MKIYESTKSYLSNIFQGFHDGKSLREAVEFADLLSMKK